MKLRDAVSRCRFTIANGNKPNETDVEAYNMILDYLAKTQEKTVQDNLLFAKLYAFLLENLVQLKYDVNLANKQINKILSEPMSLRIQLLTMQLQQMEVTQVFADPILEGKSGEELKEIFKRYPKFEKDFLSCYDWWNEETVASELNTQINLSIQHKKNYV